MHSFDIGGKVSFFHHFRFGVIFFSFVFRVYLESLLFNSLIWRGLCWSMYHWMELLLVGFMTLVLDEEMYIDFVDKCWCFIIFLASHLLHLWTKLQCICPINSFVWFLILCHYFSSCCHPWFDSFWGFVFVLSFMACCSILLVLVMLYCMSCLDWFFLFWLLS